MESIKPSERDFHTHGWATGPWELKILNHLSAPMGHQINMDIQNSPGALHVAVRRCDIPAIKELLAKGYDPSAVDRGGMTPLHWAVYGGYVEAAELLLKAGADPNIRCDGTTPLWHAEDDFRLREMATLLRAYGATK